MDMWTENSAPSAPQCLDVASIPLFDGTSVVVTAKAKHDLEKFYGVTGGKVVNGEVQVWIEGRIVNCGKVIQRSASYVSLKDVVALWIYDLRNLFDDDDQTFVLKDGDLRNLLPSNIGASPRRPEYL